MSTQSQQYLSALSSNATRLGMRLQESISEHTRELGIGIGSGGGGGAYFDAASPSGGGGGMDEKIQSIKKQLEGNSEREKLEAMKRVVALISKNHNLSSLFPTIVKSVASPSLETRKLVYIYLLKYAEHQPDLALLSINTFQKDLGDPNAVIRGMALRVLSGIKVGMVGGLVVHAVGRCVRDGSWYVRRGVGLAVGRCFDLDPSHLPALLHIIHTLLADPSPQCLGAVVVAFEAVCPERLDMVHAHFRRYCRVLVEVDEWGQVGVLGLLGRYVRVMVGRPVWGEGEEGEGELDKDLKLLLDSVIPIFQSRNPAVILAATRVLFYCGPPSYWPHFVNPLLRLLATSREVERVVIADLIILTRTEPHLFASHYTRFLVRTDDFTQVKKDKIRLLLNVLNVDNYAAIMREFIDYAEDVDDTVVTESITALGQCATRIPECMPQCLSALIMMIKSRYDNVVSSAVMVLKRLVQLQLSTPMGVAYASTSPSQSPLSIIAHLARRIDDIKHAQARACVVWLVGQYGGMAEWAPDVLRKLAKSFVREEVGVKLQVLTLASKLFVLSSDEGKTLGLLVKYVFSQARYDVNYDVRDRARMLSGLLVGVGGVKEEERAGVVLRREQVRVVLFDGKVVGDGRVDVDDGGWMGGDVLPDWMERGVESSLRDSEYDAPMPPPVPTALSSKGIVKTGGGSSPVVLTPTGGSSPMPGSRGWTDLDSFYAEEEEESEEEDEDEEETSSGEEAESSGESESEDEPPRDVI